MELAAPAPAPVALPAAPVAAAPVAPVPVAPGRGHAGGAAYEQGREQAQAHGSAALFRRRRKALSEELPGQSSPADWELAQEPPVPPRTYDFHGERVLIVDDDVRNVFALTSVLEQHGLAVLYAENGREGIEVLEQHDDVRVVLMDIMMPEMDGYATTAAIRRMPQFEGLPIIALTAKAMKGDREKAIDSGASDYVTKPVDPDYLLSVMEQHMRAK